MGEASSSERIREEKKNRDDFDTKMKLEQISQRTELWGRNNADGLGYSYRGC